MAESSTLEEDKETVRCALESIGISRKVDNPLYDRLVGKIIILMNDHAIKHLELASKRLDDALKYR